MKIEGNLFFNIIRLKYTAWIFFKRHFLNYSLFWNNHKSLKERKMKLHMHANTILSKYYVTKIRLQKKI